RVCDGTLRPEFRRGTARPNTLGGARCLVVPRHLRRSLAEILAANGADASGWEFRDAVGVSDDGSTMVGWGIDPAGNDEAWITVIPEPWTGLLFGAGLVALAAARRAGTVGARSQPRPVCCPR